MCDLEVAASIDKNVVTLKERYEFAREHLRHEDGLVNQRVTWFLVFQGLLFTALMAAFSLLDTEKQFTPDQRLFVQRILLLIMVLGFSSSLVGYSLVRLAYRHMDAVSEWWKAQLRLALAKDRAYFPPVRGTGMKPEQQQSTETLPAKTKLAEGLRKITAAAMFAVLATLWIVMIIVYAAI